MTRAMSLAAACMTTLTAAQAQDILIGWKVGVGVGGAGQQSMGHLSSALWDYDTGTWREELDGEFAEVMARVGGVLDYVHLHHPHGLADWYMWRCETKSLTRMRFEAAAINTHTADLDGLVALFDGLPTAFYFGSPRCTELCPEMDADINHCDDPHMYMGEALSHHPLYIAFDAVAPQTAEDGPWLDVKDYIHDAGVPFLVEANVPKSREDMADVNLWATYKGWTKWKKQTWPRPIEDFQWAHLDFSQAPEDLLPQDSQAAMDWKWDACFTIRDIPNLKSVTIPWEDFVTHGYPIEELAAYLTDEMDLGNGDFGVTKGDGGESGGGHGDQGGDDGDQGGDEGDDGDDQNGGEQDVGGDDGDNGDDAGNNGDDNDATKGQDGHDMGYSYADFKKLFDAGDMRADCNQDGKLTINDFVCFQQRQGPRVLTFTNGGEEEDTNDAVKALPPQRPGGRAAFAPTTAPGNGDGNETANQQNGVAAPARVTTINTASYRAAIRAARSDRTTNRRISIIGSPRMTRTWRPPVVRLEKDKE